ncbi:MAG: hypothetical protein AB1384_05105 [Actinomycetota bacterium]
MRFLRDHLLIIMLFLALAFLFALPVTTNMTDTVVRPHIDTPLQVWIMSWDGHALGTDPTALFQANINYPSRDSLAFSEHIMTFSVVAIPINWVTGNPVLTYNVLLFIGFALCGYTMFLLARYLTDNWLAALAAGVFFALAPYHFSAIIHVHVSIYCFQPLLLFFLFKYCDRGGTGNLVGLGLTFLAQALLSWYQLAFSAIPLAFFFAWRLLTRDGRAQWRRLLAVFGVLALCAALIVPFALPYLRLHRNISDREINPALAEIKSASAEDYWRVYPENWLYSTYGDFFYDKLGLKTETGAGAGNALFPGFTFFPLALAAVVFFLLSLVKRNGRGTDAVSTPAEPGGTVPAQGGAAGGEEGLPPEGRSPPPGGGGGASRGNDGAEGRALSGGYFVFFLLLGGFSAVLSLGADPHGIRNIVFEVVHKLPIFQFVRFPIRYHILVIMCMGVVVAYACAYICRALARRRLNLLGAAIVVVVILLLLLEFLVVDMPTVKMVTGDAVPEVYRDLARIEDAVVVETPMPLIYNCTVFTDPMDLNWGNPDNYMESVLREQESMYYSIFNWKPLLNGLSGYYPIFYRRALVEMQGFPGTRSLEFLAAAGVNHVVWRWGDLPEDYREDMREKLDATPELELLEEYPDDGISLYRLDAVATAGVAGLEVRALMPRTFEPGATFNASLGFLNRSQARFSNLDETRQHLKLRWVDEDGNVEMTGQTYFFAPFFLQPGDSAASSFVAVAPGETGSYHLEIIASGGILDGQTWETDVTVAAMPSTNSNHATDGTLAWDQAREAPGPPGEEAVLSFNRATVFSLEMTAANLGDTRWRRGGMLAGSIVDKGAIAISALWNKVDDPGFVVGQVGMIPCDVSPGQELSFPITLQTPYEDGEYTLTLRLKVMGSQYMGEATVIRVHVGGP